MIVVQDGAEIISESGLKFTKGVLGHRKVKLISNFLFPYYGLVMKKTPHLLLVICCLASSPLVLSENFKVSMNEFCPYHCTDTKGGWDKEYPGYVYEIYEEIYSSAGYDFKAVQYPFFRGMQSAYEGVVDAVSGPIKIESALEMELKIRQNKTTGHIYNKLIYSKQPISLYHSSCFFGRSDMEWRYNGIQSLMPYKSAVVEDFDYGVDLNGFIEAEAAKGNSPRVQLMFGNDIPIRHFRMLSRRRVDLVLADLQVGLYTINKMEKEQDLEKGSMKLLGCSDQGRRYLYVGFSPKRPEDSKILARVFDQGISRLRRSGQLKLILDKYGLNDWTLIN